MNKSIVIVDQKMNFKNDAEKIFKKKVSTDRIQYFNRSVLFIVENICHYENECFFASISINWVMSPRLTLKR